MICGICKNTLLISEGIAEMNHKKYHMSCKLDLEKKLEKTTRSSRILILYRIIQNNLTMTILK